MPERGGMSADRGKQGLETLAEGVEGHVNIGRKEGRKEEEKKKMEYCVEGERVQRRGDAESGPVRLMRVAPRGSSDGGICLLVQDKTARAAEDGLHPLAASGTGPDG